MPTLDERARRRARWLIAAAAVIFAASVARDCTEGRQAGRRENLRRIAAALCDTLCPPRRVDELTRLEAIEVVEPDTLCFRYALDCARDAFDAAGFAVALRPQLVERLRGSSAGSRDFYRRNGVVMCALYEDCNGSEVARVAIGPDEY